jgi:hypothetical protein
MKRPPKLGRISVFLILVVGGAIVNVAVAWGAAGFLSSNSREIPSAQWIDAVEARTQVRAALGHMGTSFGAQFYTSNGLPAAPTGLLVKVEAIRAGWPRLALQGDAVFSVPHWGVPTTGTRIASHGAIAIGGTVADLFPNRPNLLPIDPVWPGFAINTVFYAGLLWVLFAAPFALRRWRRVRRGLCPACAYPVGASDVCTECGASIPSPSPQARERAG